MAPFFIGMALAEERKIDALAFRVVIRCSIYDRHPI